MRTLPIGLLALTCALAACPASAATFAVDSTADAVDASPGDGLCATDLGDCTLRAAVMESNALPSVDQIDLPAGIYRLALPGGDEDASATGDLDVTNELTIQGAGMDTSVIDAAGLDRGIDVLGTWDGTPYTWAIEMDVTLRDLTVRGGHVDAASSNLGGGGGGGIRSRYFDRDNHMTLDHVALRDNVAAIQGGGLAAYDTTCHVNGGVISGNTSEAWGVAGCLDCSWGGGVLVGPSSDVFVDGTEITDNEARTGAAISEAGQVGLEVRNARIASNRGDSATHHNDDRASFTDSVIENNQATGIVTDYEGYITILRSTIRGNVGENGGGLRVHSNGYGLVSIRDSAIYDNESLGDGGGILTGEWPILSLRNTTVSGNRAAGAGGGIALPVHTGGVGMNQVTITGNHATRAGGIWLERRSGGFGGIAVSSANSIVAQNRGGDCVAGDDSVELESGGYNLIGDASGCDWTPASGDQLGTAAAPIDAMLGPLSWWSGPTLMHAPLPGSPAIDAGNPAAPSETGPACRPTDQRGVARPIDGDGADGARCDIGAMEAPWPRPTACGLGAELVIVLGAFRVWFRRRH